MLNSGMTRSGKLANTKPSNSGMKANTVIFRRAILAEDEGRRLAFGMRVSQDAFVTAWDYPKLRNKSPLEIRSYDQGLLTIGFP